MCIRDRYNTTKNCPKCHRPTDFAFPHREHRTKECRECMREHDSKPFRYDRDFGAAVNMWFVACYMARNGGQRPPEFARPERP